MADNDEELPEYDINDGVFSFGRDVHAAEEPDLFARDFDFAKSLDGVSPAKKRSMTRLEKKYEGMDGVGTKRIEDDVITGYNAFDVVLPPYNLDYLAKLYEKSAPHKSAVDAKMANIVGLGYSFVESNTTKQKMDEKSDDEEWVKKYRKKLARAKIDLLDMFDNFNKEDTFSETLQKVWKDYETTGNGYIEVGRSVTGQIKYVGHVSSTTLRIRRQRDGFVQIIANKAVFFRNFGDKETTNPFGNDNNPNELIHLKKYAPSSTYYGVPDVIAAAGAVAGNAFAEKFNLDYFENKAVPRHVIILKGATINPKLAKNILEFFETGLKGKNHRSLFIPLPGDSADKKVELKIEPVEAGIQDASFNNYLKNNKNEILMTHRVPITKVSVGEGVALAVAKDADKTFKEQVCQPEQKTAEKKVNKITKEFTDMFILKLNEMTLTDENTQSQIDERRRKTGVETANEQRARRGEPAIEGGDELFDMNAATKLAEMADETTRRGQDIQEKTAKEAAKQKAAVKPAGTPAAGANANGNPTGTRQRDTTRSAGATDSAGGGRNPKGEGRTTS